MLGSSQWVIITQSSGTLTLSYDLPRYPHSCVCACTQVCIHVYTHILKINKIIGFFCKWCFQIRIFSWFTETDIFLPNLSSSWKPRSLHHLIKAHNFLRGTTTARTKQLVLSHITRQWYSLISNLSLLKKKLCAACTLLPPINQTINTFPSYFSGSLQGANKLVFSKAINFASKDCTNISQDYYQIICYATMWDMLEPKY